MLEIPTINASAKFVCDPPDGFMELISLRVVQVLKPLCLLHLVLEFVKTDCPLIASFLNYIRRARKIDERLAGIDDILGGFVILISDVGW